jgi:hypothetical protein
MQRAVDADEMRSKYTRSMCRFAKAYIHLLEPLSHADPPETNLYHANIQRQSYAFAYSPLRSRLPTHINTFHRQPLYHTTLAIVAQLVLYSTDGYESIARTTWGLCNSRHPCKRAPLVLKHLRSKISSDCHHSKSVRATVFGSQRVHYYFRSPVNSYSQFKHASQN